MTAISMHAAQLPVKFLQELMLLELRKIGHSN